MAANVFPFPKAREQAVRIGRLIRRDRKVEVAIQILFNDEPFRVQRAFGVLSGRLIPGRREQVIVVVSFG